jgi:hypothetical protein
VEDDLAAAADAPKGAGSSRASPTYSQQQAAQEQEWAGQQAGQHGGQQSEGEEFSDADDEPENDICVQCRRLDPCKMSFNICFTNMTGAAAARAAGARRPRPLSLAPPRPRPPACTRPHPPSPPPLPPLPCRPAQAHRLCVRHAAGHRGRAGARDGGDAVAQPRAGGAGPWPAGAGRPVGRGRAGRGRKHAACCPARQPHAAPCWPPSSPEDERTTAASSAFAEGLGQPGLGQAAAAGHCCCARHPEAPAHPCPLPRPAPTSTVHPLAGGHHPLQDRGQAAAPGQLEQPAEHAQLRRRGARRAQQHLSGSSGWMLLQPRRRGALGAACAAAWARACTVCRPRVPRATGCHGRRRRQSAGRGCQAVPVRGLRRSCCSFLLRCARQREQQRGSTLLLVYIRFVFMGFSMPAAADEPGTKSALVPLLGAPCGT